MADMTHAELVAANERLKDRRTAPTSGPRLVHSTPRGGWLTTATSQILGASTQAQSGPPGQHKGRCCDVCDQPVDEHHFDLWFKNNRVSHGLSRLLCAACVRVRRESLWWTRADDLGDLMRAAGVSLAHADASAVDFVPATARWINRLHDADRDTRARGLLVAGPVGTGKTRFAVAAMRYWLLSGRDARFTLAGQLLRRLWATYRDDSTESENDILDTLCSVPLLVIDDLGREGRVSDAVRRVFHEILSRRIDNYRPVIVTTNLGHSDIAEVYDGAILSRLLSLDQVVIAGADRRVAGA